LVLWGSILGALPLILRFTASAVSIVSFAVCEPIDFQVGQLYCKTRTRFRTVFPNCREQGGSMAAIYQGACDTCDYKTGRFADCYLAVRLDNGNFKVLHHPGEKYALAEAGFTREEAISQGRLASVQIVACKHCGHVAKRYRVANSQNCLVSCLIAVLPYVLLLTMQTVPFLVRLLCAYFLSLLIMYLYESWLRLWDWDTQQKLPQLRNCAHCAGKEFAELRKCRELLCPQCNQKTLRYKMVAIS